MTCASEYAPELRAHGFRMTSQRMAILHVLHHSGTHLSPSQVYEQARRDAPGLTEPTVYRTLEFLAQNRLVRPSQTRGGHLVYEIASNKEHHHIVCRSCDREVDVDHTLLKDLYSTLEISTGYLLTDSHVTFFGLCPECQKMKS
jgi:Fe2+ or Zn2+ uptake regulation protein